MLKQSAILLCAAACLTGCVHHNVTDGMWRLNNKQSRQAAHLIWATIYTNPGRWDGQPVDLAIVPGAFLDSICEQNGFDPDKIKKVAGLYTPSDRQCYVSPDKSRHWWNFVVHEVLHRLGYDHPVDGFPGPEMARAHARAMTYFYAQGGHVDG